jgi:hypothetical protein
MQLALRKHEAECYKANMFRDMPLALMLGLMLGACSSSGPNSEELADATPEMPPADAQPTPDAALPDAQPADFCFASCDDGQSCTSDSCVDGVCVHEATATCAWPAESAGMATNLSTIPGQSQCIAGVSIIDNDFSANLSGAAWNPVTETLWLVVNGPGTLFAAVPDGNGWKIAEQNGEEANWELANMGDAEAVTLVDFAQGHLVYTLDEGGVLNQWDTSDYSAVTRVHNWSLPEIENGNSGGEGLTFVPDEFLVAQGFVDPSGDVYQSVNGMGGLMFVGFQGNGDLYVYDLDPNDNDGVSFVGRYETGGNETAGLEFDRSTGVMHIWHDEDIDQLELVTLASEVSGSSRKMTTQVTYSGPDLTPEMASNIEGLAVVPVDACVDGRRRLWLLTDGGACFALMMYEDFPC